MDADAFVHEVPEEEVDGVGLGKELVEGVACPVLADHAGLEG